MSDREVTKSLFIKRVKSKQYKKVDKPKSEKKIKERKRVVEDSEADLEIKEFTK